ncbi:MAG: hypothetical protein KDC69_10950 [Flavobacteriaceae bacterium]|nr:hypothetical protein [Flavobacteriaceae bacterium]MCB0706098.1 hypothetical protein [Saprospiraceae bacterium]
MNNNRNRTGLGIIAGIAAGAVAGWWLNSDNGRKWRKTNAERIVDYGAAAKEAAESGINTVGEKMTSAVDKGKDYLVVLADMVKERLEDTADIVDDTETAMERGAKKAKQTISKTSAKVQKSMSNGSH